MRRFVSCLLLCAAALPRAGVAEDVGCARDTDCKGERICEQRVCVEPPSSSAQSKPALPPRALDVPPAARVVREESLTGLWVAGTITASVVYVVTVALAAPLSDPSVRGQALTYTLIPVSVRSFSRERNRKSAVLGASDFFWSRPARWCGHGRSWVGYPPTSGGGFSDTALHSVGPAHANWPAWTAGVGQVLALCDSD